MQSLGVSRTEHATDAPVRSPQRSRNSQSSALSQFTFGRIHAHSSGPPSPRWFRVLRFRELREGICEVLRALAVVRHVADESHPGCDLTAPDREYTHHGSCRGRLLVGACARQRIFGPIWSSTEAAAEASAIETGCLRYFSVWDSYKGISFSHEIVWNNRARACFIFLSALKGRLRIFISTVGSIWTRNGSRPTLACAGERLVSFANALFDANAEIATVHDNMLFAQFQDKQNPKLTNWKTYDSPPARAASAARSSRGLFVATAKHWCFLVLLVAVAVAVAVAVVVVVVVVVVY